MDTIILDPVIPYVGPLSGGSFFPKTLVKLEGVIPPHAYGFNINLQCGPDNHPHDDVALQISARVLNGYFSLNSSQQGIWGKEIRLSNIPIEAGQTFKINVLCEFNQYKVAINDEHYCIFPQRIPYKTVSHLSIDGDVSITCISHESNSNSISDSTTPFTPTIKQFDDVQHSNSPPSYDTAMNSSEDVESQNKRKAHIAIFKDSPVNATLKNGWNTFFIFLRVIVLTILLGCSMFFIVKYAKNEASYSTNSIPSIDFTDFDQDLEKHFKEVQDIMASQKKMDEEKKEFNDIIENAKKTEDDTKYLSDLLRTSTLKVKNDKVINNILANSKKMDEDNTFVYDFVQSPDLIDELYEEVNDILEKLNQN